ncbi:MAG: AAA family ATPase [Candidatus Izemoplasmatales bacterium]
MLVKFRCKNFRSFRDEAILSMQATSGDEHRDFNTFEVDERLFPKGENVLLKSAVIYGPNASGKSNLIKAIRYMQSVVVYSSAPALGVVKSNEPFALCDKCLHEPTVFEMTLIQDQVLYRYGFTIMDGRIQDESLERKNERMTKVYQRRSGDISIIGLDDTTTRFIRIDDGALFLSVFQQYHLPDSIAGDLNRVRTWFSRLLVVFEENVLPFVKYEQNPGFIEDALRIMRMADIGIRDFSVYRDKIVLEKKTPYESLKAIERLLSEPIQLNADGGDLGKLDLKTVFDVRDEHGTVVGEKIVHLLRDREFHSEGTRRLMFYLGWILASLHEGRVILIDEIDTKFHVVLADYLMRMYNSIDRNPLNSQLVGTAHNILLMDGPVRRDQILFASKDPAGASSIRALSDYKGVRKNDLFSKKYLLGFYSGVPDMTEDQ